MNYELYRKYNRKISITREIIVFFLLIRSNQVISLMIRVFANGSGDRGSIPGQVIPKT